MNHARVLLHRIRYGDTFIVGELFVNNKRIGQTMEYPWRENTGWDSSQSKGSNFRHVSCVREGIYYGHLRADHEGRLSQFHDKGLHWRLELAGTVRRTAIEFHAGNALIRDSKGCILCGEHVFHANGVEPYMLNSEITMKRFVDAILGDLSGVKNSSEWGTMMRSISIIVTVIGMPAEAWLVH